jgi:hypothetical protein
MTVRPQERSVTPGAVAYDDADVVIRAEPITLHRLTSGDLSGREAIVGGLLDIRKAPSLPKLLQMRALFNRYKKALQRGEVTAALQRGEVTAALQRDGDFAAPEQKA